LASRAVERSRILSRIFHITSLATWAEAQAKGSYTADSLVAGGFIHCSDADQVIGVANRFRGRQDLVLLHIDPSLLGAEVRFENLEGGRQLFPHVYGPIPISAVVVVTSFPPSADGTFGEATEKEFDPDVDPAIPPSS
jgi:uncharacterized protein (DUF952 family)